MRIVKIVSQKDQQVLADKCQVAESFLNRLQGLIGKRSLLEGEGLMIHPCNDIHMWFMRIAIDVIFIRKIRKEQLGEIYQITSFRKQLRPWKVLPVRDGKASTTLELPAGLLDRYSIAVGDELCIS